MTAPRAVYNKEEKRTVILFIWPEVMPLAEIHRNLLTQYSDSGLLLIIEHNWMEKFKIGWSRVTPEKEQNSHQSPRPTRKFSKLERW